MGLYVRGRKMWWMSYTVNRDQRFESCHTHNKRLAQKMLNIRLAEIAEKRFRLPASNSGRLKEWAEEFLNSIPNADTRRRYCSCVANLIHFFREARLSEVTADR